MRQPLSPFYRTFPDNNNTPASFSKRIILFPVSRNIAFNLCAPEFRIAFGQAEQPAIFVAMPEATIHKYHTTIPGKHYIRRTGQIFSVQPIPVTCRKQGSANYHFRSGIFPLYTGHHAAAFFRRYDISQIFPRKPSSNQGFRRLFRFPAEF